MKAFFHSHIPNGTKAFRISFFRRKLFPLLLIVMTFFLMLGITISNIVETSIKNKLDNDSIMLLTQTKRSFESVMSEIYALTLILTYDTSTARTIKNCLQSSKVHYSDVQNIKSSIVIPLVATRAYIDSIYIYFDNPNGIFFANTEGIRSLERYCDTGWYKTVTSPAAEDKMIWSEARSYYKYDFTSSPHEIVTLYQRNLYRDGIIVLNLNRDYFNQQLNEMSSYEGQMIYIFDEDGKVLFCNTKTPALLENEVAEMLHSDSAHAKNRDYYLSSAKADFIPEWTFVSIVPKRSLYAPIRRVNLSILFTMILACILGSILASLRVWQSYRSIHRIMTFIDHIKKDPQGTAPLTKEPKEYEFIVESLIDAYTRENALNQQLLENKYTEKVLELKSLQAQINPHFLLNTLQSIFWASFHLTNSYNNVSKMIENLNTILGYLLESDNMLVPMTKELRNLESYISIQQIRSSKKFGMIWDVSENLYSVYTVKLLFQPLLENAIHHGFSGDGHWLLKFRV
ncbi:MAG: histidine kinase, partial [Clostridiaceae bacterium]|nr:histidine kinase [Clostridiaceae bacterium]